MSSASSPKPGQFTAMISSTAQDLPKHRAAVKEACLAAGIFPIGMEHLAAQDATGVAVSMPRLATAQETLAECEVAAGSSGGEGSS